MKPRNLTEILRHQIRFPGKDADDISHYLSTKPYFVRLNTDFLILVVLWESYYLHDHSSLLKEQ